jgi:hypothetical protein
MNGRLAALAEQAGYFIKFERTGDNVTVVHTKEPGTDGDLALFAELIVQECAKVLDAKLANPDGWCDGSDLLEHFGVEE